MPPAITFGLLLLSTKSASSKSNGCLYMLLPRLFRLHTNDIEPDAALSIVLLVEVEFERVSLSLNDLQKPPVFFAHFARLFKGSRAFFF